MEITIPRNAILEQRYNTGRCGPCQRLNVELNDLKLREVDPGCGRKPPPEWKCKPCIGREKIEDMTLYGRRYRTPYGIINCRSR